MCVRVVGDTMPFSRNSRRRVIHLSPEKAFDLFLWHSGTMMDTFCGSLSVMVIDPCLFDGWPRDGH